LASSSIPAFSGYRAEAGPEIYGSDASNALATDDGDRHAVGERSPVLEVEGVAGSITPPPPPAGLTVTSSLPQAIGQPPGEHVAWNA
jgi:hypothetical protein